MTPVSAESFADELMRALTAGAALVSTLALVSADAVEQWWPRTQHTAPGVRHFVYSPPWSPVDYHLYVDADDARALLDVHPRHPLEPPCPPAA